MPLSASRWFSRSVTSKAADAAYAPASQAASSSAPQVERRDARARKASFIRPKPVTHDDAVRDATVQTEGSARAIRTSESGRAVPLVVITDAGADLDDEMALILLRHLVELGLVDVLGVVASLQARAPSRARRRARDGDHRGAR